MPAKIKTVQELRRELKAKMRSLAKLRAQRRKLVTRAAALDRKIGAIAGAPAPKRKKRKKALRKRKKKVIRKRGKKAPKRGRGPRGKSLVASIADVLAAKKDGMRTKEVAAAVQKAGYKTKSKDFYGIVSATLRTPKFKRIKRGVYTLR